MTAVDTCLQALNSIKHYLDMMVADVTYDPHVSTLSHISKLLDFCDQALDSEEVQELEVEQTSLFPDYCGKVIASCDASIKNNPGGPSSSGIVIRFTDPGKQPWSMSRILPTAITNNQAEYDSIYEALNYFTTYGKGSITKSIEIRTDSKVACNQINGLWEVKDKELKRRCESVKELLAVLREGLQIPIEVVWYPRNSTEDLKQANYIAQDVLGVKNH